MKLEKLYLIKESVRFIIKKSYRQYLKIIGTRNDRLSRSLFRMIQLALYIVIMIFIVNIMMSIKGEFDSGKFGDFFGGVLNPILTFLTFMGLLMTILIQQKELRLTREESTNATRALKEQAELMKESATLTALSNIYAHYGDNYGRIDNTGILSSVALGHRQWAIRESFSAIDSIFDEERANQVNKEYSQLEELLMLPKATNEYMKDVSRRISSLLLDGRLPEEKRKELWRLYELVRSSPQELLNKETLSFKAFEYESGKICG